MHTNTNGAPLLSHWWRSDSCRQAFERANKAKAEKLAKVRAQFEARKEQIKRDAENWKEVAQ